MPLVNVAILVGSVFLIAVITVRVMRIFTRAPARRQLFEDGIVLTEDGVEFLGLFWMRGTVTYGNIESVKVVPFLRSLLPIYGFNVLSVCTNPFKEVLVIRVKEPSLVKHVVGFRYLKLTPKNAATVVEQLNRRIPEPISSK